MIRFWQKKRGLIGDQRGFTLIELMIVIAIIGILAAIAIPIYSNMQARARTAKAQSDLRGLYSALVAFGAHCGDVPGSTAAFTGPSSITWGTGSATCASVTSGSGDLTAMGNQVTDANSVPAGPFYQPSTKFVPPVGWTYKYDRTGTAQFTLVGTSSTDMPSGSVAFP